MKTTVIIPTYNEKENIQEIVTAVFGQANKVKNHDLSILVVDDNSPDGTQDVVKKLQKKFKKLHMITGKKEGLGKAYLRGMKYASEKLGAEVMFEMDADFSHDPTAIPSFLKKIDEGYELVIGSRYIKGGSIPDNWGLHRKILSVFGNMIVRISLFSFSHKDWTTGYRAIRTPLYKKIRGQLDDFKGYTFQVSFLHKAFQENAKVAEVPIHFKDRVKGHSKIGSEYVVNLTRYLIETNLKNPPRQFKFLVVGTIGFLVHSTTFGVLKESLPADLVSSISQMVASISLGLLPVVIAEQIAITTGALLAITSNFILNNFWTFQDRKKALTPRIILSYLKFALLSSGSIVIQNICIYLAIQILGEGNLADWSGFICGVLLGLVWNYLMYSRVIWKVKKV